MSVHFDRNSGNWVIRFRAADGQQRSISAIPRNFAKYGLPEPTRFSERAAKRLEAEILRRETSPDGSIRSGSRRKLMYLDVVARYIPPLVAADGEDVWQERPVGQPLENERTYSDVRIQHMLLVLTKYFPSYLDHGMVRWRRNGRRNHSSAEKVHACTRRMAAITREDVTGFQIFLMSKGIAPATVRGYVTTLGSFLSWSQERGYLVENPAKGLSLPSRKKKEVRWLEQDRVKELLKAVSGCPLEGPVLTILWLGVRRGEMISLEWRDVNFEADIVRIRGTKSQNAFREVRLPPVLAKYFKSIERSEGFPNVLLNTNGEPWNKDSLNSSIRRFQMSKRVSFHWNFQMLRATYGSLLVQQGIPIAHVSLSLGHSDVRITQDWYIGLDSTHVSPEISKAITRALS